MTKTFHLLLATLLLGIHIFNALLIAFSRSCLSLLKATLTLDKGVLIFFILLLVTGTIIVPTYHWHYDTPWIKAAYGLLIFIALLWGVNAWLKSQILKGKYFSSLLLNGINLMILIFLILIIKDAVTKHTWI